MTETQLLFDVIDKTWPAASAQRVGPWLVREGRGGGQRVSAATAVGPVSDSDIPLAEAAQKKMGQPFLFMIRPQDSAIDVALERQGYQVVDPVVIFRAPCRQLMNEPVPRVTIFAVWEPLAIMSELWAGGGIGPERQAVMTRAAGEKTGFLARRIDKPAGAGFAAIHSQTAMVHALEIAPQHRRHGLGAWVMRAAAHWAAEQDATDLTVMCTRSNAAACGLYAALGMVEVGGYHYRRKPDALGIA